MQQRKKTFTLAESLTKIQKYCAYQERSHQEVRDKLYSYGLHQGDVEEILSTLITSGFLNEERFAKSFAGGKFRMKKWGRNKIENELKHKGISSRCIQTGLKEIDQRDYQKVLRQLITKKAQTVDETNLFKKRNKVASFVIGKGYEPELVWSVLMDVMPD
jgi:regulatory protein